MEGVDTILLKGVDIVKGVDTILLKGIDFVEGVVSIKGAFVKEIVCLHGFPTSIVPNRDRIFLSIF